MRRNDVPERSEHLPSDRTVNSVADWRENETAFVVVDMWDRHWCETATTRVAELAVPMNETLTAVSIERKPATVLQRR